MNNKQKGALLMAPFIILVVFILMAAFVLMITAHPWITICIFICIIIIYAFLEGVEYTKRIDITYNKG